ncbi:MAG: Gmad2 immunoglobulin-like domain-containing protein [bacterium]|nr:Gmad2 immunoglobulin-like domain-containing protein [bacterium]
MKKTLPIIIIILIIVGFGVAWKITKKEVPVSVVTNFAECAAAGNPVMESYPRQCRHGNQTFREEIGNEFEKKDLIRIDSPRPNQIISSPLSIKGQARGNWFFEASFPVVLTNWDGLIIAQGIATAKGEWMTTNFVPFEAILTFTVDTNTYSNNGTLILKKDNPSGIPANDDALEIPVMFAGVTSPPKACSQEAKLCSDGSAVGRTGPNCEFAKCPGVTSKPATECTKDSDCPSSQYICQETQGTGTVCPSTDPTCVPTHSVIAGECKFKAGNRCTADLDCASGNVCSKNVCTSPIGRQCTGPSDTSCPTDFTCVQSCGPPVVRYPDDTPPSYFCQLSGYVRMCPICLAKNTLIDTPLGGIVVQDLVKGARVWTVNNSGKRVIGTVIETSKTPVPSNHKVVKLALDDGRTLFVSPGHPTIDGRMVGDLALGDMYDGAWVVSIDRVDYREGFTYDILSSGETGFYFANDILLDSTLRPQASVLLDKK